MPCVTVTGFREPSRAGPNPPCGRHVRRRGSGGFTLSAVAYERSSDRAIERLSVLNRWGFKAQRLSLAHFQ